MNPLDLSDVPFPEFILNMEDPEEMEGLDGLEFSAPPQEAQMSMPKPEVPQQQPTAPMGAAPAAPVEPRPAPAPAAKAASGYSTLTQSQSSSQDSRADSLFGG